MCITFVRILIVKISLRSIRCSNLSFWTWGFGSSLQSSKSWSCCAYYSTTPTSTTQSFQTLSSFASFF
jgi:hypothetical protein